MSASAGRLVILSGPSGVGKTPLTKALKRFYPDLAAKLTPLVLYNSRAPRPGEQSGVDYHFRTREHVDTLRAEARYVVLDVRGDLQALDLEDLSGLLQRGDVLFEGNPRGRGPRGSAAGTSPLRATSNLDQQVWAVHAFVACGWPKIRFEGWSTSGRQSAADDGNSRESGLATAARRETTEVQCGKPLPER